MSFWWSSACWSGAEAVQWADSKLERFLLRDNIFKEICSFGSNKVLRKCNQEWNHSRIQESMVYRFRVWGRSLDHEVWLLSQGWPESSSQISLYFSIVCQRCMSTLNIICQHCMSTLYVNTQHYMSALYVNIVCQHSTLYVSIVCQHCMSALRVNIVCQHCMLTLYVTWHTLYFKHLALVTFLLE